MKRRNYQNCIFQFSWCWCWLCRCYHHHFLFHTLAFWFFRLSFVDSHCWLSHSWRLWSVANVNRTTATGRKYHARSKSKNSACKANRKETRINKHLTFKLFKLYKVFTYWRIERNFSRKGIWLSILRSGFGCRIRTTKCYFLLAHTQKEKRTKIDPNKSKREKNVMNAFFHSKSITCGSFGGDGGFLKQYLLNIYFYFSYPNFVCSWTWICMLSCLFILECFALFSPTKKKCFSF